MMRTDYLDFGGLPPRLPLRRAALALASEVTYPPLRPKATAAGFLRGTVGRVAGDVLRSQLRDAFQRQIGNLAGQSVEGGEVPRFQGGIALGHQVAACLIHTMIIPNRLGSVKW